MGRSRGTGIISKMLGIIGGSGLYNLEGLKVKEEKSFKTPFGEPSSPVLIGELEGREVAFLARHGRDHSYPPHLVPYRANLWAFREVGVDRVLAVSAVGSINRLFRPGDFVLIDSFIDLTRRRESTYYEGRFSKKVRGRDRVARLLREGKVVHIDVSEPYCPEIRSLLMDLLEQEKLRFHPAGVYACTEGPRFETPAEIEMLRVLSADVVGMTGCPEVVLARELTMCYVSLCVVANPAAGISSERLTSDEVMEMMSAKEEEIRRILRELVKRLPSRRSCGCKRILEGAEV